METNIETKLCRVRLAKLAPDEEFVNHKIVYRRRKGGFDLIAPMAGGEARRAHKEGKWCYWLTITCPTDTIKRGDLILDVPNQVTSHVQMDVSEELINILNNDLNVEKVIASRNDKHFRLGISDEDVERYINREISNRVQVQYEIQIWEEKCGICDGTGKYPKYPQLNCKCKYGYVIKEEIKPLSKDNVIEFEEHQTVFTRDELITQLHRSLGATKTNYGPFAKVFEKQLDNWIDKNL